LDKPSGAGSIPLFSLTLRILRLRLNFKCGVECGAVRCGALGTATRNCPQWVRGGRIVVFIEVLFLLGNPLKL